MKKFQLLYILLVISFLSFAACKKKETAAAQNNPAPNPKACTQKCPDGEELILTDCSCQKPLPPAAFSPDSALQIQLINAVVNNDVAFVKKQLDANMHINSYLSLSAAENILQFRESLKQNYPFLYDNVRKDTSDLTLLFLSVAANKQAIFDEVMSHNPDVGLASFGTVTPYKMAMTLNDLPKVKALLEHGATPNLSTLGKDNDLSAAIEKKDFAMAKMFTEYARTKGIDLTPILPTISKAVESNNSTDLIAFLIDSVRQDPNTKDSSSPNYPLATAMLTGNIDAAKMLIAAGANLDIKDDKGRTPLMLLISKMEGLETEQRKGIRNNVLFLLQSGAKPEVIDNKGKTALFYAVEEKDFETVEALVAAGADINHRDNAGETAIFAPAKAGNIELVKNLLQAGAAAKIKNKAGTTPAMFAVQSGYMDLYDTLEAAKK